MSNWSAYLPITEVAELITGPMHSLSAKTTLIRESRNIGGETYWSLSVRLITAVANLGLRGYEHAASTDIRRADLSLSPLISCLACNHCVSAQAGA